MRSGVQFIVVSPTCSLSDQCLDIYGIPYVQLVTSMGSDARTRAQGITAESYRSYVSSVNHSIIQSLSRRLWDDSFDQSSHRTLLSLDEPIQVVTILSCLPNFFSSLMYITDVTGSSREMLDQKQQMRCLVLGDAVSAPEVSVLTFRIILQPIIADARSLPGTPAAQSRRLNRGKLRQSSTHRSGNPRHRKAQSSQHGWLGVAACWELQYYAFNRPFHMIVS